MERFKGDLRLAEFKFTLPNSRIFICGVPLSGKSTLAPLITGNISDCTLQNMDILRLTTQMVDEQKPKNQRNAFVQFGSCDSYKAIGDGSYTPESLIDGFKRYAEVVCSSLDFILPKLETQGARDVLFEGVQLTPDIVQKHLNKNSRLIIITSTGKRLRENAEKMFGEEEWLLDRYSPDKLILLQDELIRQARTFPKDKLTVIDNSGEILNSAIEIMNYLLTTGIIERKKS